MNGEHHIDLLAEKLKRLGFPEHLQGELRLHCRLEPEVFWLTCHQEKGGDQLTARLFFQRRENGEGYTCRYYDAVLKKRIEVPGARLGEVDLEALDAMMSRIQWKQLFKPGAPEVGGRAGAEDSLELVGTIAAGLRQLDGFSEGGKAADLLRARHWQDTPLETYCHNLTSIRSAHQVLQRFYLFDGEAPISLEEAYRFLQYRYQERKLQGKGRDKAGGEDPSPASPGSGPKETDSRRRT